MVTIHSKCTQWHGIQMEASRLKNTISQFKGLIKDERYEVSEKTPFLKSNGYSSSKFTPKTKMTKFTFHNHIK